MSPCSHPHKTSFTFSDSQRIQHCCDCTFFDAARHEVLCPPGLKIETRAQAKALFPKWELTLSPKDAAELSALNAIDHGHNPNVLMYGFTLAQLADLPPIDLWAHHSAVQRRLQDTNGAKRHQRLRKKSSALKAEMRRRCWSV
jgi:hypothetical protein